MEMLELFIEQMMEGCFTDSQITTVEHSRNIAGKGIDIAGGAKMKLVRDKVTGDYYTEDRRYQIEKGFTGWNVNEIDTRFLPVEVYRYSFSCETLSEVRESL